jgi:ATP-dependent Lon protease
MTTHRTLGRANPDRRELASCVLALAREAATAHAMATSEVTACASHFAPSQLPLQWDDHFSMRICNGQELERALAHARGKGEDNAAVEAFLTELQEQPVERALSQPPLVEALAHLADHFPNFSEVVDFILRRTALALLDPTSPLSLPPIVLDGPPGVGKTAFASALAYALDVPILSLQMAHATGPFDLAGLDPKFSNGGPGLLVRTVALGKAVDPLVLLDELDKVPKDRNHDPIGPLYSLLEPSTAKRFIDDGIKLPMNMSHVRWICTTNDVRHLHPAIASRCQVFQISAPTLEQGRVIACNVYATMLKDHAWGRHFAPSLSEDVADLLARDTPRELTRALENALGLAALEQRPVLLITDFAETKPPARGPGFL